MLPDQNVVASWRLAGPAMLPNGDLDIDEYHLEITKACSRFFRFRILVTDVRAEGMTLVDGRSSTVPGKRLFLMTRRDALTLPGAESS